MTREPFDQAVYAANGRYLVEEINTAQDAIDYMEGRSFDEDDLIAQVTYQALNKCLRGLLPVSAARETFFRMLKKKGLLVQHEQVVVPPSYVPDNNHVS